MRWTLLAISLTVALAAFACGEDDDDSSTESPTPTSEATATGAATGTPSAPPTTTPTPTIPGEADLDIVLALPGFAEFAQALQAAVEANDTQFFIDHAYFEDYSGCQDTAVPTPAFGGCGGIETPPDGPAMVVGLWNSEGGYFTPDKYAALIDERLSSAAAPDARAYAIGQQMRGSGEPSTGIDLVAAGTGSGIPAGQTPLFEPALVIRADVVEGEWVIVSLARGTTDLVPGFFRWWVLWEEAFPPA